MKILVIYNNLEVFREKVSSDTKVIDFMVRCFEEIITKADINEDEDQVTTWLNDTHITFAYRAINGYYDVTIIKNYDTFSFICDETGLYLEDGKQIKTIGDLAKIMGIIMV